MNLTETLKGIRPIEIVGNANIEIKNINIDSRRIQDGHLFVAMRGTVADGHKFITKAIEQGAVAILCEEIPNEINPKVCYIKVESTEDTVGKVATHFHGDPSHHVKLVGVTGTNGKTTIATLLYQMFRKLGYKCGLISTVCNYIEDKAIPTTHTTPDPIELNCLLQRMQQEGCQYVFMECSSHAIAQKRIGGLYFAGGIFTNLTRDHLDYHKTFENYRNAKKAFFDMLPKTAFALTNADDKNGMYMVQNTKAQIKTYSTKNIADFKAKLLECHFQGMILEIDNTEIGVQFIGKFNVSNLLAVYAAAILLGQDKEKVLLTMSMLHSVSGRLEPISANTGVTAVVDYAHTPDALANVLTTLKEVLADKGKLITICGAGGNRDKGKRPIMAQEAAKQSDKLIITSDNPRYEEPQDIINDMLAGLNAQQLKKTISITDRKEAIKTACMLAKKGDVILIAGKGHEDYQEINGIKHHFDDREVAKEMLSSIMPQE